MIRVVIVEDSPTQLEMCRQAVLGDPKLHGVAALTSAEDAEKSVDWRDVDVLLTDLALPGASGVSLIARARAAHPTSRAEALRKARWIGYMNPATTA